MNTLSEKSTIAGTYDIKVHTPMGDEDGTLHLNIRNNALSGKLENKKGSTEFTGGTVEGNKVNFNTKIKTPMGRLKAQVTGQIEADNFTGTAKLPLGSAKIEGKRVQAQEGGGE